MTSIVPVPIPDRVAALIGSRIPIHVLQAEVDAEAARADVVGKYRCELYREDREDALSRIAAANKVLAAYNPGLIVRLGGAR